MSCVVCQYYFEIDRLIAVCEQDLGDLCENVDTYSGCDLIVSMWFLADLWDNS